MNNKNNTQTVQTITLSLESGISRPRWLAGSGTRVTGCGLVAVGHASHGSLVATVLVIAQAELTTNSRLALAGTDRGANVVAAVVACSSRTARR